MKKNNKGFTLAELLIVVAVIAVLVAVAIPTFTNQLEKSRQAVDISNLREAFAAARLAELNQEIGDVKMDVDATTYSTYAEGTSAFYRGSVMINSTATNNVILAYYNPKTGELTTKQADAGELKARSTKTVADTSSLNTKIVKYGNGGTTENSDLTKITPTTSNKKQLIVVEFVPDNTSATAVTGLTWTLAQISFKGFESSNTLANVTY